MPESNFGGSIGSAGGGGGITSIEMETPTGAVNGVNDEFVFTSPPIQIFLQGILQNGADYTLVGATVTFTVPPVSGTVKGLIST